MLVLAEAERLYFRENGDRAGIEAEDTIISSYEVAVAKILDPCLVAIVYRSTSCSLLPHHNPNRGTLLPNHSTPTHVFRLSSHNNSST